METHSSVLAWRILGMEEPLWAAVYGVAQSRTRLKRLSSSSSSNMQNIEHNLTSMGDECNCPVVRTSLSTALLGNWNED